MAPDISIPEDGDDTSYNPDSSETSYWNRIAASKLPTHLNKAARGRSDSLADEGHTQITSPGFAASSPSKQEIRIPSASDQRASEPLEHQDTASPKHPLAPGDSISCTRTQSATDTSCHRTPPTRRSAPDMRTEHDTPVFDVGAVQSPELNLKEPTLESKLNRPKTGLPDLAPPIISPRSSLDDERLSRHSSHVSDGLNDPKFWKELEARWILNLSMAFRDNSEREKFFITYAEEPNRWRRVTVSVDYRNKPSDSLEADLQTLPFQRDKSAHIYEAIHDSLPSVQFFDTVTNLRLETSDGRLHVHVTKDENEIIKYPSVDSVGHLDLGFQHEVLESDIHFQSHLSGFVYKVSVHGKSCIKKEIPGPDMIDEFLYEVNALWQLRDSPHVIDFCAVVLDDKRTCIKGLLISYASRGTLVDIIYDNREPALPWARRDKWARQIVAGLADIHDEGFVQGDFTLSNIVIDESDNARIIDINRRGCPVGWEPPEFQGLIGSGQRISMYIGNKSDLFQLGMVLWAIAVLDDEPERAVETLTLEGRRDAPSYLIGWVTSCLSEKPRERLAARELLSHLREVPPVTDLDMPLATSSQLNTLGCDWERMDGYAQEAAQHRSEQEKRHQDADYVATTHRHHDQTKPDGRNPGIPQFHRFLHQDSGLAGMDDVPTPIADLAHQDSGFQDEQFFSGNTRTPTYQTLPSRDRRVDDHAFSGLGGQFG